LTGWQVNLNGALDLHGMARGGTRLGRIFQSVGFMQWIWMDVLKAVRREGRKTNGVRHCDSCSIKD